MHPETRLEDCPWPFVAAEERESAAVIHAGIDHVEASVAAAVAEAVAAE